MVIQEGAAQSVGLDVGVHGDERQVVVALAGGVVMVHGQVQGPEALGLDAADVLQSPVVVVDVSCWQLIRI